MSYKQTEKSTPPPPQKKKSREEEREKNPTASMIDFINVPLFYIF